MPRRVAGPFGTCSANLPSRRLVVGMVADGHFGYADGAFDDSECKRCEQMVHKLLAARPDAEAGGVVANSVVSWALNLGYVAVQKVILCSQNAAYVSATPLSFYADLLHCLVGNPFAAYRSLLLGSPRT